MKKILPFLLASCCLLATQQASSQQTKKIYILGSSTAAGNGATMDSSWAARLQANFRKNISDNLDTLVVNYGYPGHVTYQGMPLDVPTPPNRTTWTQHPVANATSVMNDGSNAGNVAIISYPSNDVNLYPNYTTHETMENFRILYQRLNAAGIRTFITSMQPRNDMSLQQRTWLKELTDSITNNFGYYSINVYNDLVATDGTLTLRADLNSGDGVHPNNTGHRLIYQRIVAKQLFGPEAAPLPVRVTDFRGQHESNGIRLTWRAAGEEPGTSYEVQRSSNGRSFSTIHTLNGTAAASYSHVDAQPDRGDNFYRLLIREANRTTYTPIVKLNAGKKDLYIQGLQLSGSLLKLDVGAATAGLATLSIVSMNGAEVLRKEVRVAPAGSSLQVPVDRLAPGEYVLTLRTATAQASQRFIKH